LKNHYKEVLSGFLECDQLEHAGKWLLFPENIGPRLAIDESALSNGEIYTFVTNRDARTREQCLIAVQELRIKHRWDAIKQANDEMEEAKIFAGIDSLPFSI